MIQGGINAMSYPDFPPKPPEQKSRATPSEQIPLPSFPPPPARSRRVPIFPDKKTAESTWRKTQLLPVGITIGILCVILIFAAWISRTPALLTENDGLRPTGIPGIKARIDAPREVYAGEAFSYRVILENATNETEKIIVTPSSTESAFSSTESGTVYTLLPHATQTIGQEGRARTVGAWLFSLKISRIQGKKSNNLQEIRAPITVLPAKLSVWLDPGDMPIATKTAQNTIPLAIRFENTSGMTIRNAEIQISGNPRMLEHLTQKISLPNLIHPREKGTQKIEIQLAQNVTVKTLSYEVLSIKGTVTYSTQENGKNWRHIAEVIANPTKLLVTAFPRLHDAQGKMLSEGPVPLRVGEASRFWINLSMNPETRAVGRMAVTAKLPAGVKATGRTWVTRNDMLRVEENGRITWVTQGPHPRDERAYYPMIGFEVEMKPKNEDAGTTPVILEDITVQTNEYTQKNETPTVRTVHFPALSSDFRIDTFMTEKGVVIK